MTAPTDSWSTGSGTTLYMGRAAPVSGGIPAYIAASAIMAKGLVPNSSNGPAGLNDYSGWAYAEGMFVNPGFYGHQDGSYNGVDAINVTVDSPTGWVNLCAATPIELRTNDSDYYADGPGNTYPGKPSAVHGYHTAIYVPSLRKIFKIGKRFTWDDPALGGSTTAYPQVDSFDMVTHTWSVKGTYPNLPAHNGGAVMNNSEMIYQGSLGFKFNPSTGVSTTRTGGTGSANRYPQANNSDDNYILNFTLGDGGESTTTGCVASYLVGDVLTNLTVNASTAFTQLQADNPFAPGLTWCKPLNKWLFYHGKAGRQNTIYTLDVNRTANTVDVGTLTITGGTLPTVSSGGLMSKFTYVDALKTLFICNDVTVGINFVRMA